MNHFIKRYTLKLAKQRVVSKTMSSIKPVSKGGTRLITQLDLKIAVIEMSKQIQQNQISIRSKEDRIWHANL